MSEHTNEETLLAAEAQDQQPLAYRLLSGPDDRSFCERVSAALAQGYILYGSPSITAVEGRVVAAQAVVLPGTP